MANQRRAVTPFLQRTHVRRQVFGEHRHDSVGKIYAIPPLARFLVDQRAVADIVGHVGDRDNRIESPVLGGGRPDGIVMVARIGGVDRDNRQVAQVLPLAERPARHVFRFGKEVDRKDIGDFELVDRDEAERPWRERIAKHFLHAGGDARRASGLFGQDQIPRSRAAQIGDQRILPIALVDGLEPMPPALFCNHPQQQLLASCELLHRMRDMAVPALLDPCKDAIADAQRTPPPALDNAKPGRRNAFRFPTFGNSDYLPIVDIGNPENRYLGQAAHLVEGPAGC